MPPRPVLPTPRWAGSVAPIFQIWRLRLLGRPMTCHRGPGTPPHLPLTPKTGSFSATCPEPARCQHRASPAAGPGAAARGSISCGPGAAATALWVLGVVCVSVCLPFGLACGPEMLLQDRGGASPRPSALQPPPPRPALVLSWEGVMVHRV